MEGARGLWVGRSHPFVTPPPCRQDILASCITELVDRKLIGTEGSSESLSGDRDSTSVKSQYLRAIAEKTEV